MLICEKTLKVEIKLEYDHKANFFIDNFISEDYRNICIQSHCWLKSQNRLSNKWESFNHLPNFKVSTHLSKHERLADWCVDKNTNRVRWDTCALLLIQSLARYTV